MQVLRKEDVYRQKFIMKYLLLFLFSFPLLLLAQEGISYTSPLSEYIGNDHRFEEIDRTIVFRDDNVTIKSKDEENTDIQTWLIVEKVEQGSDMLYKVLSADKKFPSVIKVFNYSEKVERIEVKPPPLEDNILIRFHTD